MVVPKPHALGGAREHTALGPGTPGALFFR